MSKADSVAALLEAAVAEQRSGRRVEAKKLLEKAMRADPRRPDSLRMLAIHLLQDGEVAAAIQFFRRAVAYHPSDAGAHNDLGNALSWTGKAAEAIAAYDKAIQLRRDPTPDDVYDRGCALRKLARPEEALADFDRALAVAPRMVAALLGRANALQDLRRFDEALAALDAALALEPGVVQVRESRANALMDLGRFDEAFAEYDAVLAAEPDYAEGWANRGAAHQDRGHLDLAMADYERALALDPENKEAPMNIGFLLLLKGDYQRGFPLYEKRWSSAQGRSRDRGLKKPLWLGEDDLAGRRILLYADQGFGDTLQFCRYVPLVAARGGRVVLEVQPSLAGLLAVLPGVEALNLVGQAAPPYDVQCPLASLPLAFNTTLQTIPSKPYLPMPKGQPEAWAQRLGPHDRPRIGLAWSGNRRNPTHVHRTVPRDALIAAMPPGVELHNLQVEFGPDDEAALAAAGVIRSDGAIADFAANAGLLAHLDLVVTVDTALAHLCGALGSQAWMMVPHTPDWRWGLTGETSAWYDSLRLLRQDAPSDWSGMLVRLKRDLATWAAAWTPPNPPTSALQPRSAPRLGRRRVSRP